MARQQRKQMDMETLNTLTATGVKKYARYAEGAMLYSMGLHSFQALAKDANAVRKVKNVVLVNLDVVNEFIEAMVA